MNMLEKYIRLMQEGNVEEIANLFSEDGILHDSSWLKVKKDILHVEGRKGIEMLLHNKVGFNGGKFNIANVKFYSNEAVSYIIKYGNQIVEAFAYIKEYDENGYMKKLYIYAE